MIFDNKPIDDISDEEIDELVREHMSERQHLEFKITLNHQDDSDRLELLRDIVSLTNAGGGYLIIGIRDDGKGRAQKYEPAMIGDRQKIKQAITSLCLDHIRDRIDGLEIRLRTVKGNPLVIMRIPSSARVPHMVTFQHRTDFYTRYEDGKKEMTLSEIREALNQDIVAHRLSRIETQLRTISSASQAREQRNAISKGLEPGVVPQFLPIVNGSNLAEATLCRFVKETSAEPYFRTAITPMNPNANLVDVDSKDIRQLITNPPGSRRSGWNMESGSYQIERFAEGIRRGEKDDEYLELLNNGHMEFWAPLNEHFCWRQSPEEFRTRPRLYPYPVTEYPVTFLRLYRALVDMLGIASDFLIDLRYMNLQGYILLPYAPNTIGFMSGHEEAKPLANQHLVVPRASVTSDFDPDREAYNLIRTVYAAFGLAAEAIPFFTEEGKFDFPS